MTEKERKFKIKKIEKYNNQIGKEQMKINTTLGISILALATSINIFSKGISLVSINDYLNYFAGFATTATTIFSIEGMIQAISKKTLLEGKIEDLNDDLQYTEIQEKFKGSK